MKKATQLVNVTSETILSFVLIGVFVISFLLTSNLSNINVIPETSENVLGTFKYNEIFNPIYYSDDYIKVKESGLDVGGESLNISIKSKKSEEVIKFITIYNNTNTKMSINAILDFVKVDSNANYYLLINDKEQLIKDTYRPEQYNVLMEIEPEKEVTVSVKVKSMERIDTEFNVVFSEN